MPFYEVLSAVKNLKTYSVCINIEQKKATDSHIGEAGTGEGLPFLIEK